MQFTVLDFGERAPSFEPDQFYLHRDDWNDWWKYRTLFHLSYVDADRTLKDLGSVKIGQFGLESDRPSLPPIFDEVQEDIFSLGQDASYYEAIRDLGSARRIQVLTILGDIALNEDLRRRALNEDVTKVSLLRDIPMATVSGQFARLANGGARLTEYYFDFHRPAHAERGEVRLSFEVIPESLPPTNIHVLIGRNGVGKSTILNDMGSAFRNSSSAPSLDVSNVVTVSFSAFDEFPVISEPREPKEFADHAGERTFHYIGLKKEQKDSSDPWEPVELKNPHELQKEIAESTQACMRGARRERLIRALTILENDPIFAESQMSAIIETGVRDGDATTKRSIESIYYKLSSGHKIVLLTMTRLVEVVEEKSLVLLDEPEAHLHPPLLSAFIRALSDLLTDRNGLAVIATHSPVVLQEVPRSCVWKLSRVGAATEAERPELETFAENVGTLTNEVFGLEVINTGFHELLTSAAVDNLNYNAALERFDGQVGIEGRGILRSRIAQSLRS